MLLQEYLSDIHDFATPEQWGVVQSSVPRQWIEQALQMSGVATLRKRRLPMEQALWLGGFKSEVQHLQPCKVRRCKAPRDTTSNFSLKTV